MTKAELIKALEGYPDDALVLVDGYERGYDNIKSIQEQKVFDDSETEDWWNGSYKDSSELISEREEKAMYRFDDDDEDSQEDDDEDSQEEVLIVTAVVISRA